MCTFCSHVITQLSIICSYLAELIYKTVLARKVCYFEHEQKWTATGRRSSFPLSRMVFNHFSQMTSLIASDVTLTDRPCSAQVASDAYFTHQNGNRFL